MVEIFRAVRPYRNEVLPYDYCILVLGALGNGKSTFINTFINVCLGRDPNNLITAIESRKYPEIYPNFRINFREEENYQDEPSHTRSINFYKISSELTNYKTFLLIDTPGFGNPEGIHEDDKVAHEILKAFCIVPKISAILIIEKSVNNRLTSYMQYYILRLSEVIPNAYKKKIILGCSCSLENGYGYKKFYDDFFPYGIQFKVGFNNTFFNYNHIDYMAKPKILKKVTKEWRSSNKKVIKIIKKVIELDSGEASINT